MENRKPNILFAIADDASHMGAYGYDFVRTPNFDKIAQNGVLFNNAFTTNPKCAPSRASILTGMHTWQLEEACLHFGIFPDKFKTFVDVLTENGYHAGYTGKGWGPGDWKAGGRILNPAGIEYNCEKLIPPENSCISNNDYTENFRRFLLDRKEDEPFCFWYGCREPHRPYKYKEGEREGIDLSKIKVPSYWPDCEIVKNDINDYAFEIEWFDRYLGNIIKVIDEIGELDNTIIIVTSDNGMPFPRIKGQMYEQDFRLPLAICWGNKIKGNRVVDDLVSFIDFFPTILDFAHMGYDKSLPGKSLKNILETDMQGYIEKDREYVFMGKERHDIGRENDKGYPVRCIRNNQYLYVKNYEPDRWPAGNPETNYTNVDNSPTKELIIKLNEQGEKYYYNLSFGKRASEELYDIRKDPECVNNLATDEKYYDIKQKLACRLNQELEESKDPRYFGKGEIFDTYKWLGSKKNSWEMYLKNNNTLE